MQPPSNLMESFLSRYRNPLLLLAVVLAQMLGIAVQVRRPAKDGDGRQTSLVRYVVITAISPFERVLLFTGHGISGVWHGYLDLRHVRAQNRQLQTELSRVRLEEASLAEDAQQNARLQKLFAFQQHYVSKTVAAHVIGTSGTDLSRVLYLDKGAADGLHADMPVITPDGVVGKLRDVFPHTSQLLEIDDQTSGLGVILTETRLRGILRGTAAGQTEIIDILPDERIRAGEPVVTSGGDRIYPRGLPVGTVDRVIDDPERNPYVAVLIRPAVNLSRLDEVLVITQTDETMPAAMQQDIATSEQKASDILAQRLPGATPAAATGADGKPVKPVDVNAPPPPVRPPVSLHPDRFTPGATPAATDLIPGSTFTNRTFPVPPPTSATGGNSASGLASASPSAAAQRSNTTASKSKHSDPGAKTAPVKKTLQENTAPPKNNETPQD
ncbi:MAG: rod shape-determining protein MreC [Acidobacteriaceae bacterium]